MNIPPPVSGDPASSSTTMDPTSTNLTSSLPTPRMPTPPQAHQHPVSSSGPLSPPLRLSSPSPAAGLSPPRLNPSPHSPISSGTTLALIFPGGEPIPLTVGHTSPIGKHGGTLGALTASVNALQRPISSTSLHAATSSHQGGVSPGGNRTPVVSTSGNRTPMVIPFNPAALGSQRMRSPKQKSIMTTKTPIFMRSNTVPSTSTGAISSPSVTASLGMVRVSPSTQLVRAQIQMQAQVPRPQGPQGPQGHMQASKQMRYPISRQISAGAPQTIGLQQIAIRPSPTSGPVMRTQNTSSTTISDAHARLQQALANAAAKYRAIQQRKTQFGGASPTSPPPPMGLVAPSIQQRTRPKSIPNPPTISQTLKPAPHIPILPKASPSYTPIMPKPVNLSSGSNPKRARMEEKQIPRPQFSPSRRPEVGTSKKSTQRLPTATVSATATNPHKTATNQHNATIAGIIKEVTDAFRPEISATRPEVTAKRPEASVKPEVRAEVSRPATVKPAEVRTEVSVSSELPVVSDVVTIRENGFGEKEIPRAIVRPQVLTHVIDGFIIEESREPFPVAHVAELPDAVPEQSPPKPKPQGTPKQQKPKVARKDSAENATVDDGNNLTCEFCGKVAPARTFTRSKRFCSKSCAKRYNVGCSKRLGLFSPKQRENNLQKAKHRKQMQTKAQPPKGVRGKKGRLAFNVEQRQPLSINKPHTSETPKPFQHQHQQQQQQRNQQQQLKPKQRTDSTTSSSSSNPQSSSDSSRPPTPSQASEPGSDDEAFDNAPGAGIPRDPAVWNVQHVYDFIRTLPGCESYADEFRRQEIDGQALLLLKEDHLMTAMNMKLGPALKIISKINSLKNK